MGISEKHLNTLEFPKVLAQLAGYTAFSASRELVDNLRPTDDVTQARRWQRETAEAVQLLSRSPETSVGGARDVREPASNAARGAVLDTSTIMAIKGTVASGRDLKRSILRHADEYPFLAAIAHTIDDTPGLIDLINRTLDERGEVLDTASPRLGNLRAGVRTAHDRLMQKLQSVIGNKDNHQYLQETLITQRGDRYVVPLRAEFKGRIPGIVHDRSSSGATLFIEPMATVELNNRYRELQLEVDQEIQRILAELSAEIGARHEDIARTVEALAALDFAFAKARYADDLRANPPTFADWQNQRRIGQTLHPGCVLRLRQVRHPLLSRDTVVPIDVDLGDDDFVVVVTGPNTGGKTVGLKTIGLAVLMAQAGLHIPAKSGAELTSFDNVFVDIGDEQSIEQSLSTFSSHITNIIGILNRVNERSLVILDEIGAGTDPEEGSALARAILQYLVDRGATTFATTHYSNLKLFAHGTPGVANASVEFDAETLAPTYRLMIGLPGRSHALTIAARLGLEPSIVDEARGLLSTDELAADDLITDIMRKREQAQAQLDLAEAVKRDSLALEDRLQARLEQIEAERREVLARTEKQAERELTRLEKELRALRHKMQAAALPLDELDELKEATETLESRARKALRPNELGAGAGEHDVQPFRLGDTVWVPALSAEGTIMSISERDAEVQVGRLKLRTDLTELSHRKPKNGDPVAKARSARPDGSARKVSVAPSPGIELDIRGERVEDGLQRLERYLDAAYLARLPWVRIIHGKGTGRLRQAVRDAVQGHPLVRSAKTANPNEGGDGVTIIDLIEGE